MVSSTAFHSLTEQKSYYARGRETFIRLSLLALMGVSCVLILLPFLKIIICGMILAIAIYPAHQGLTKLLSGRSSMAAVLCSILLLAVVVVPCILMAGTLADGIEAVIAQVQAGHAHIPPPPPGLAKVPVLGPRLADFWNQCSNDASVLVMRFRPQIQKAIPTMLSASAGIGAAILQFLLAILLAGFLLATSNANERFADKVFIRIFGEHGAEFKDLVNSTIRTVTNGVLGVAAIQTVFAALGFWIVGLPGAGLWALIFLVASILQMGAPVLIPAVLYAFAAFSTTRAVIFLVWCIFVGLMDNVLKPILLGRSGKVPMIVIFLGVLGGFIAMKSLIGLFVGAVVLSVGYKLFMAWLDSDTALEVAAEEPHR
jgi:predicted PurR-regulated permease PerM